MAVRRYHRRGSSTQTDADAERIAETGELWGGVPRYGAAPCVQAFHGALPEGAWGIEFETVVPPDATSMPSRPEWRGPRPGVNVFTDSDGVQWAKIAVTVVRIVHQGEVVV
jgi:hypothetical protein